MEKREMNVSFYKNGAGSISTRMNIPKSFLEKLGINQEEKKVEVILNDETQEIIIRKKK